MAAIASTSAFFYELRQERKRLREAEKKIQRLVDEMKSPLPKESLPPPKKSDATAVVPPQLMLQEAYPKRQGDKPLFIEEIHVTGNMDTVSEGTVATDAPPCRTDIDFVFPDRHLTESPVSMLIPADHDTPPSLSHHQFATNKDDGKHGASGANQLSIDVVLPTTPLHEPHILPLSTLTETDKFVAALDLDQLDNIDDDDFTIPTASSSDTEEDECTTQTQEKEASLTAAEKAKHMVHIPIALPKPYSDDTLEYAFTPYHFFVYPTYLPIPDPEMKTCPVDIRLIWSGHSKDSEPSPKRTERVC